MIGICVVCGIALLKAGDVFPANSLFLCCAYVKKHWDYLIEHKLIKEHPVSCVGYHWWCISANLDKIRELSCQTKE
jgi:hypothetical protein